MCDGLFIPADELKLNYRCFGHFYTLLLRDGPAIPCRSVLEIVQGSSVPKNVSELCKVGADALIIMMNPGSSRPAVSMHTDEVIDEETLADALIRKKLVPTIPDTTQYQVMRIMSAVNWRHVRVLNLSDIRNPDSNSFFKLISRFETGGRNPVHSIFSPARSPERDGLIRDVNGPVIAGWGQSPKLSKLSTRCVATMNSRPLYGVSSPEHPLRFAHPSPRVKALKCQWLIRILEQITP